MQREYRGSECPEKYALNGARGGLREPVAEWKQENIQEGVEIGRRETLADLPRNRFREAVALALGVDFRESQEALP